MKYKIEKILDNYKNNKLSKIKTINEILNLFIINKNNIEICPICNENILIENVCPKCTINFCTLLETPIKL
jgi:hypothetical protein